MTTALHALTARELAARIAAGATTPEAAVDAALARIAAIDPQVRAWSHLDGDGARAEARRLGAEAAAGTVRGPLHGVPIGVKDQFRVRGMPTRLTGSPTEAEDATVVARLRAAGAVILGKLYMPLDGQPAPTRNPWNTGHTPGGSSSGSGAAVGARMVPLAVAEQTSGSGLRPAAYCGVAGLKPTYELVSRHGCVPLSRSFDHPALIAQDVGDLALALSIVGGADPFDPETRHAVAPSAVLGDLSAPRLALAPDYLADLIEPDGRRAVDQAAARLERAGARLQTVPLAPSFGLITHVHALMSGVEGAEIRARQLRTGRGAAKLRLRDVISAGVPATYYSRARRLREVLRASLRAMFAGYDALLLPAATGEAPPGFSTGSVLPLRPWSTLGYPAITVNAGLSAAGMPLGIQLVSVPGGDHALCRTAAWCESILGRLGAPPLWA